MIFPLGEERYISRELATTVRNKHAPLSPYFPVQEVAQELGFSCISAGLPHSRWHIALQMGAHFKAPDSEVFARSLMVPLYLLEPIVIAGKDTGKKRFFGLLKKRETHSIWELANMFGVPEFVIAQQCAQLL